MNIKKKTDCKYIVLLLIFMAFIAACSDHNHPTDILENLPILPEKELRGIWMTTAWGLDWPMGNYDEKVQKKLYTDYLDLCESCHINAIFFQVRSMADAFYDSRYESWSKTITGVTGQKPSYDVLNFLIDEAHKRGIQFHAWINPYRIATRADKSQSFSELDAKIPQMWVKDYDKVRIYNPALPEVWQRISDIVKELLSHYDVDGIHFDDYFYPSLSSSESMKDDAEYAQYGKGTFGSIEDFRRHNVDTVVQKVQQVIRDVKPWVVFSISPAADNTYNYNTIYADVLKWSQNGWTDVIIPQLYFSTGTDDSSFNQLLYWWSQFTYKNTLMVGYGIYKFGDSTQGEQFQSSDDLKKQFAYATSMKKVKGGLLYSAKYLTENKVGITDVIKDEYKNPALPPCVISSMANNKPEVPSGVLASKGELSWTGTGQEEVKYAVYKSNGPGKTATLLGTTSGTSYPLSEKGTYFVTSVNRYNVESDLSKLTRWGN
ncbi:UPF0748 protein YngK [Segatella asaccharophila]